MRLPFVSTWLYDQRTDELRAAQARIVELTDTIVDMKVTGATLAMRRPAPSAIPKKDDIVAAAIERNPHAVRPEVRRALEAFAARHKASGATDEEIVVMLAEYRVKVEPTKRPEDDDGPEIDPDTVNWDDPETIPIYTTAPAERRKRA